MPIIGRNAPGVPVWTRQRRFSDAASASATARMPASVGCHGAKRAPPVGAIIPAAHGSLPQGSCPRDKAEAVSTSAPLAAAASCESTLFFSSGVNLMFGAGICCSCSCLLRSSIRRCSCKNSAEPLPVCACASSVAESRHTARTEVTLQRLADECSESLAFLWMS